MVIGIDTTFFMHGGTKIHVLEFIKWLKILRPHYKIVIYTRKENINALNEIDLNEIVVKVYKCTSINNKLRVIWQQFVLPLIVIRDHVNVLICPQNFSPILKTSKLKVQWINTIGPFCKEFYQCVKLPTKINLLFDKILVILSGITSDFIIYESEYSRKLLNKIFQKTKLKLIIAGKNEFFNEVNKNISSENKYIDLSGDILCVSNLYPNKKIDNLIRAYANIRTEIENNAKLYIVGNPNFENYYNYLVNIVKDLGLDGYVIFTGEVNKNELKKFYSTCRLFVYPSLCESAGYILIEAMSCGSPILASNRTAIPYTCAEAGVYFDPDNIEQLSSKMKLMMNNDYNIIDRKIISMSRVKRLPSYKMKTSIFLEIIENSFRPHNIKISKESV